MIFKLDTKILPSSTFKLSAVSLAISASILQVDATQAATIRVNSNLDSTGTNNNVCILRDAIESVNETTLQGGCVIEPGTGSLGIDGQDDEIVFDSSLSGGTIMLDGAQLITLEPVIINASALDQRLTIDGGNQTRIFELRDSTQLNNLILTNGDGGTQGGGAIRLSVLNLSLIHI